MKAAPFGYFAPETLDEALATLAQHGDDAKIIAGGQSLVPMLAMRLAAVPLLIDLGRLHSLRAISQEDASVVIGAMVTHASIERDAIVHRSAPLLAQATAHIGHEAIRSRGTLGGSLSHADPAAEHPAVALALDAEITAASIRGERQIAVGDFFEGVWTTALEADEILVRVSLPPWGARSGFGFREVARRHGDFALAGVAVGLSLDPMGRIERAAVALLGVAWTAIRLATVETALIGELASEINRADLASAVSSALDPPSDLHASSSYRKRVGGHLAQLAVGDAIAQAQIATEARSGS